MNHSPEPQEIAGSSPAAAARPAAGVATLARDLSDFLVEFSIVLHKRTMYPAGHPHLEEGTSRFVHRLDQLLERREWLIIGVARHQLIIGGVATEPRNALLSDLARRLHRQRVASLRFERGVAQEEVDQLLGGLTTDPDDTTRPLGLDVERTEPWQHIQIQAPEFGRLLLDGDAAEASVGSADELWIGLANLALSADEVAASGREDPLIVARAIDDQVGQAAYDRVVLDYLASMAEEISGDTGGWDQQARERVSRLVANLHPETLRSLLLAGANHAERRRFVLMASEVFAVDAVVELVEAAALTTGQTISNHLLRLLHKFAQHAESGGQVRTEAESVLRRQVARLVADLELDDPNPSEYTAVLDGMARHAAAGGVVEAEPNGCEAESVLQIGLETGCLGPRVYAALDRLGSEQRFGRAAALLAGAPSPEVANALWGHVATPARLRDELASRPMDFATVEGLALRLGETAVDPLLDRLETAEDQGTRAKLLKLLGQFGSPAAQAAVLRLPRAPWYMQRNVLVLLRTLRVWPEGFSPVSYARHADYRVRREAYRLLLDHPQHRTSTLNHGLADTDAGVVQIVLHAALESCPPESVKALERFLVTPRHTPELRALAVRVLARATGGEQAHPRIVQLAGERRFLRGWRLAPKSPVVLAALSVLAKHWSAHPEAAGLLDLARAHPDPDFRLAAEARFA
ncbi:MAG: hypothetical protein ACAI18_17890 [Gemmatimonadales bacterium]